MMGGCGMDGTAAGRGLLALALGVPGERRAERAKPEGFVSWEMYLFN